MWLALRVHHESRVFSLTQFPPAFLLRSAPSVLSFQLVTRPPPLCG